jgi:hypothetical protein
MSYISIFSNKIFTDKVFPSEKGLLLREEFLHDIHANEKRKNTLHKDKEKKTPFNLIWFV